MKYTRGVFREIYIYIYLSATTRCLYFCRASLDKLALITLDKLDRLPDAAAMSGTVTTVIYTRVVFLFLSCEYQRSSNDQGLDS